MKMTVSQILDACKGTLLCGEKDTVIQSVCIDSRKVTPGALFVPIKGERNNGHDYIDSVLEAGAAATLTQEHDHAQGQQAWIRVEIPESLAGHCRSLSKLVFHSIRRNYGKCGKNHHQGDGGTSTFGRLSRNENSRELQ